MGKHEFGDWKEYTVATVSQTFTFWGFKYESSVFWPNGKFQIHLLSKLNFTIISAIIVATCEGIQILYAWKVYYSHKTNQPLDSGSVSL